MPFYHLSISISVTETIDVCFFFQGIWGFAEVKQHQFLLHECRTAAVGSIVTTRLMLRSSYRLEQDAERCGFCFFFFLLLFKE